MCFILIYGIRDQTKACRESGRLATCAGGHLAPRTLQLWPSQTLHHAAQGMASRCSGQGVTLLRAGRHAAKGRASRCSGQGVTLLRAGRHAAQGRASRCYGQGVTLLRAGRHAAKARASRC